MLDSLDALMASFERSFADEGPGWAPWSESYAASQGRRAHGPLPGQVQILTRTGDMRASAADPANYDIEFDKISWGGHAAPEYTDFHLEGTVKMPERSFLNVDEIADREVLGHWSHWMEGLVADTTAAIETFSGNLFSGSFLALRDAGGRFA